MPASTPRLLFVGVALSGWMTLLFAGVTLGGAIHLLLLAGLVAFPWREPRTPAHASRPSSERSEEEP